jgi:hypothetical protein
MPFILDFIINTAADVSRWFDFIGRESVEMLSQVTSPSYCLQFLLQ